MGNGRDAAMVEITRNGAVIPDSAVHDPDELEGLIRELLGPSRTFGPVVMRGLQGLAAIPPAADTPLLVLERTAPSSAVPERDETIPRGLADAAAAILGVGAGVVLAGPYGPHVGAAIRAVCARLGPSARLVMVEDGPQTPVRRDAIRLRDAPYDALRALKHAVVVINRGVPPTLPRLSGSVLVVAAGRTPEAVLARLTAESAASSRVLARLCADAAPLLLWLVVGRDGARVDAAYEILSHPDSSGLPALQLLAGTDPETRTLIPTGAVPVDPALSEAWAAVVRGG